LKRFKRYYPDGVVGLIKQIEHDTKFNTNQEIYDRVHPGEDIVRGYIEWQRECGYAPKSMRQALATLQNALKYYGVNLSFSFKEKPPDRTLRRNKKHEWALDEVKQYVEAAGTYEINFTSVSLSKAASAYRIFLLDYENIKQELESETLPLAIEGYRKKTGEPIKTFIGTDTVKLLRMYLESRVNIRPQDPIFTMLDNDRERATPASIQKLREYAVKLDFIPPTELENGYSPARSHSLRSGFRSRLTGKMDDNLIEFFMAHLSQEKRTYINQPTDELREIYTNYEHLLSIETTSKHLRFKSIDFSTIPELPEEYA
jgi:hypothetical protein